MLISCKTTSGLLGGKVGRTGVSIQAFGRTLAHRGRRDLHHREAVSGEGSERFRWGPRSMEKNPVSVGLFLQRRRRLRCVQRDHQIDRV